MYNLNVIKSDITQLEVDAIVNAANKSLLGGGGVDGAIHRVAGSELLDECKTLSGCETGEAKLTKGYKLKASYVIHTVGPVWNDGTRGEDQLLANCYKNSLQLANNISLKSIAFPAISTGVYGFPIDRACRIALKSIRAYLKSDDSINEIYLVCFDQVVYDQYNTLV
ncbi:MAG TPA: O-acetyl-ADP-ribose deacetylase [Bacteroidetes bacterium]|nr:O-acetyl-ADP-ribose deacetylase [Bacteroidota bacterium]